MLKLHKPLAFILLVIFLANMGLWSFAKQNVSHELKHAQTGQLAPDHEHRASGSNGPVAKDDSLSTVQHQVLHAVDHVQLLAGVPAATVPIDTEADSIPLHFPSQALPRPALDQPFKAISTHPLEKVKFFVSA